MAREDPETRKVTAAARPERRARQSCCAGAPLPSPPAARVIPGALTLRLTILTSPQFFRGFKEVLYLPPNVHQEL